LAFNLRTVTLVNASAPATELSELALSTTSPIRLHSLALKVPQAFSQECPAVPVDNNDGCGHLVAPDR